MSIYYQDLIKSFIYPIQIIVGQAQNEQQNQKTQSNLQPPKSMFSFESLTSYQPNQSINTCNSSPLSTIIVTTRVAAMHPKLFSRKRTQYALFKQVDVQKVVDSLETYEQQNDNLNNDYFSSIQKSMPPKPRKRRRKQVNFDKRRRRNIQKNKQKKHQPIPFSYIEDRQILTLVLEIGPKFYKIAKCFPGRTLSMVKNRYYKTLRFNWGYILGNDYEYLNAQVELQEDTESQHIIEYEECSEAKIEDTSIFSLINSFEY